MIFWKDIITRLKLRLSYEDLRRICIEFADCGREVEPLSAALSSLAKMNNSKDWFRQWQLEVSPSLKKIADAKSREVQALQCRVEIMENLQAVAINDFLITFKDTDVRDFLLSLKYSDVASLTESERRGTLINHYAFCLLTDLGLTGLYEQQFEKYIPLDEFSKPYQAICRTYSKVLCYKGIFNELLLENENPEIKPIAAIYKDNISKKILYRLHEAKEDFEAWIQAGHVDGVDTFRTRLLSLANEYSDYLESVQKAVEALPKKVV